MWMYAAPVLLELPRLLAVLYHRKLFARFCSDTLSHVCTCNICVPSTLLLLLLLLLLLFVVDVVVLTLLPSTYVVPVVSKTEAPMKHR